jgi:tRNA uridine 5-carboxymethylaminomethyl modification enzyme
MIDDLVTRGVSEPYRMFTSRAEYRLSLRADNADERLTPLGIALGIVSTERASRFGDRQAVVEGARKLAKELSLTPTQAVKAGLKVNQDGQRRSALHLIAMAEVGTERVKTVWPEIAELPDYALAALEADALYVGYLERQEADIVALRKEEQLVLPNTLDYRAIESLSAELKLKLSHIRPSTLAQASRIDGMTPSALGVLLAHIKRRDGRQSA